MKCLADRYFKYGAYIFFTLLFLIVFFKIIDNIGLIFKETLNFMEFILKVLRPFIIGFIIAYLFNPLVRWFENNIFYRFIKSKKDISVRIISIFIVYLLVIGIVSLIITMIAPQLANSIGQLISNIPQFIEVTEDYLLDISTDSGLLNMYDLSKEFQERITQFFYWIEGLLEFTLNNIIQFIINITSIFMSGIIGFIIAFYLLKDKEKIQMNVKKMLSILLHKDKAKAVMAFFDETNELLYKFVISKSVDSIIIGILCLVGLTFLNVQYAILISLIICITNIIPYFGPIIGGVPAVLIVMFEDPVKALWVAVYIIVLQQFDALILAPKLFGDSVGLSQFGVIFSIIVGGAMFGITGMLLGVPFVAILKLFLKKFVFKRIWSKREPYW